MEEKKDQTQQQEEAVEQSGARNLPAPIDTITLAERAKYFAGATIGIGGITEILGMGGIGVLLALLAGGSAAYFSEEIRGTILDRLPAPRQNKTRRSKLWWFITGQTNQEGEELVEPVESEEHDADTSDEPQPDALVQHAAPESRAHQTAANGKPLFPAVPEDEMLKLGYVVAIRQRFDPPMNGLLGRGALLAGSQGTGKSNIIGLIAQSGGQCRMPVTIIDYKGEFYTLRGVVPNCILAGHPSYADEASPGFYPLTVDNAAELARIVMEGPFQVVVDVPSYNGDGDEVAQVIAALLHGLMDWSRKIRRQGEEPWPCLVITDEAHNFLPERQKLSGLAMKKPTESFGALASAYSRMANTGRSYGYTLVMVTQRLPNIAKWSIANLQVKVILAHAEKNDLDACEEETGGLVDRQEIKGLEYGTGIVMGLTKEPLIVHFDKQKAKHVSTTPTVERAHETFKDALRPHLSRILARLNPNNGQYERVDQLMSEAQRAYTTSPRQPLPEQQTYTPRRQPLTEQIAYIPRRQPLSEQQAFPQQPAPTAPYSNLPSLEQDVALVPPQQRSLRHHQEKYARAIAVWHELEEKQSANMRDFAVAMSLKEAKAYNLLCEMERLQLIHWERRKKKAI